MKKTLLAAALLAGFAGAAQAELSVTLYGILDAGIGYNKVKAARGAHSRSRIGMVNGTQSGSRWGMRGSEDLGDGLRAVFNLESGFTVSDGVSAQGGRLFGRQATLGLAGDAWGTLEFGRQTNIASKYLGSVDPFGTGFGQAGAGHALSAANTVFTDNLILYRTPDFNGFQFGIGYSFSMNGQNAFRTADNVRAVTTGLRYNNGPLNVALTYDQARQISENAIVDPVTGAITHRPDAQQHAKPRMFGVGISYDFEVIKLAAAYARTTDGWFTASGVAGLTRSYGNSDTAAFADGFKANSYMLGTTVPVGTGAFVASWVHVNPKNNKLTGNDKNLNVGSVGYTYDFSMRTNLYSYVSYAKNYGFVDGAKSTAVGLGLRHLF